MKANSIIQGHLGDDPMVENVNAPLLKAKKGATVKLYYIILVIWEINIHSDLLTIKVDIAKSGG